MAEPLSIATAVITLLKTTWTVGAELKKFHSGVLTVSKTLKDLEEDVNTLAGILVSMRDTFESIMAEHGTGDLAAHWRNVAKSIDDGNGIIRELRDELHDVNKTTAFLDAARKQLRLNLAEDKLASLRTRVHSLRETLQLSLQVITVTNQVSFYGNLTDLCQEIRRLAQGMNEKIESQHAVVGSPQDEQHVAEMINLRECVRSAATIVSSASTAIASEHRDNDGSVVVMSDFGDCFPREHSLAISRWIEAPLVKEYDQGQLAPPPRSVADVFFVDESIEGSDSDIDLEDDMTTALLEDGQQKLAIGNLEDAERVLKKCSVRLQNVVWEPRGGHAMVQFSKHAEVLRNLCVVYQKQERWAEAQAALTQKLNVEQRMNRKKDAIYLADVATLARLSQRRGDTIQALLYARRALKGFKKVQDASHIRSCLLLLIELCSTDNVDDDAEVYTIMLSRLAIDFPQSVVEDAPRDPEPDPCVVSPLVQGRQRYGFYGGPESSQIQENERPLTGRIRSSKASFNIMRQMQGTDTDILPYAVQPEHAGRRRNAKFQEILLSDERQTRPRSAQDRHAPSIDEQSGITLDGEAFSKGFKGQELTYVASERAANHVSQDTLVADGVTDHVSSDEQAEDEADERSNSPTSQLDRGPNTPTIAEDAVEDTPSKPLAQAMHLSDDDSTIQGRQEDYIDKHSMHSHEQIISDSKMFEAQHLENIRLPGGTTSEDLAPPDRLPPRPPARDSVEGVDSDKLATFEERPMAPPPRGSSRAGSAINGDVPNEEVGEVYDAQDWGVFTVTSKAHIVEPEAVQTWGKDGQRPESPLMPRISLSSSTPSRTPTSNITSTTSEFVSPASTNVTVPSTYGFFTPEHEPTPNSTISAEDSSVQAQEVASLHATPSKQSRRHGVVIQQLGLIPRRSWTQEAADYKLSLAHPEPVTPSPSPLLEIATSKDFQDEKESAITRLDTKNLAIASGEPDGPVQSIGNSSIVSVAGIDAAVSTENVHNNTRKSPKPRKGKTLEIAFIGDGLCGKTSLFQ